jgi:hypothetical protein
MAEPAMITFRDESFVISLYERMLVAITEGDATIAALDAWKASVDLLARSYPDGIGLFFIIGATAQIPIGGVRTRASDLFKSLPSRARLMATVIEGSGFSTAAKRAAFALISKDAIGTVPGKVFGETLPACEWVASEGSRVGLPCPRPIELLRFVSALPRPSAAR